MDLELYGRGTFFSDEPEDDKHIAVNRGTIHTLNGALQTDLANGQNEGSVAILDELSKQWVVWCWNNSERGLWIASCADLDREEAIVGAQKCLEKDMADNE